MKKRIFSCLLCTLLCLSLAVGCGSKEDGDSGNNEANQNSEKSETDNSNNSSENDFPYTLIVDNVRYEFPLTYDEFLSLGWVIESDKSWTAEDVGENTIEPDSSGTCNIGIFSNGNIQGAWPFFANTDQENEQKIKDCQVVGISFDDDASDWDFPSGSVSIEGPNGTVTIGESTSSDVLEFIDGQYTDNREYTYMGDNLEIISFEFDEQDVIKFITFKCSK